MSKRKRASHLHQSSTEVYEVHSHPEDQLALLRCIYSEIRGVKKYLKRDVRRVTETVEGIGDRLRKNCSRSTPNSGCPPKGIRLCRDPLRCTERQADCRNLQLHIEARLPPSIYTGKQIKDKNGAPIRVVLIDANADCIFAHEPSIKLDDVVLGGYFNKENWTEEEFEESLVGERKGKPPLLDGDLQVTLSGGVGEIGNLAIPTASGFVQLYQSLSVFCIEEANPTKSMTRLNLTMRFGD